MNLRDQMNGIYRQRPLEEIPWNLTEPPEILVELVRSGRVRPCEAADLGCGAGNHAVWLAGAGFTVTGFDFAQAALDLAEQLAEERQVTCRFEVRDLTAPQSGLENRFDFAFDWEVLHHVFPDQRDTWIANVHRMLRSDGTWLTVSFAEEDPAFGGTGKYRDTPLGTRLYFSSEEELRHLVEPLFTIEELATIEIPGRLERHQAIMGLLVKADR